MRYDGGVIAEGVWYGALMDGERNTGGAGPPSEVDNEDGNCSGDGDPIDKSPTSEWVQKNTAQEGNSVEHVRRDSPPEPTTCDTSYEVVSEHACDSVDEEMGGTIRSGCKNGGPVFMPASNQAPWRECCRRHILAIFALILIVVVSGSLAGTMLSKRSSKEPDAVVAIEPTASPSPTASPAPTTKPRPTAKPMPTAEVVPIIKPTTSPTVTPTILNAMVEPLTATPTVENPMVVSPSMAPSTPETSEPSVDCQLVKIEVNYDNATIIGWTLVEIDDNEQLFDEGTYVDSFYSSDPDVASQPQVSYDCLKSGSYRWFTYGNGEGSYNLATPSGTLVEGTVEFRENVAFVIP